ncbi:MAG: bis(5'-nucleosyl)-tetraphosphatase (symmetrical) YqeK [Treponema sp.]|nr:bis(5'-nucleosyl)-tetraphosphatase (symmetrical) YqeK [Treponema sp.]
MKTDILKLIEEIEAYTKANVKAKRFDHSVRVAQMCTRICRQNRIDENLGYLAGIGHDMCKDMKDQDLIKTALKDGNPVIPFELKNTGILHGRAASVLMKEKFGINDEDILQAVAVHTSGSFNMCDLAKILFIADKIEPGRPQSTDQYRANLLAMSLDQMFVSVFEENYEFIKKHGYEIYPDTEKMLEYYKGKLN